MGKASRNDFLENNNTVGYLPKKIIKLTDTL